MEDDLYIGVMSGTSMDGIDAVLCSINKNNITTLHSHSEEFSYPLRSKLQQLTLPGNNELDLMGETSVELGESIANTVNQLIKEANISSRQITAIGSHGQTIRHRPNSKKPFSLQIGDPSTIAHLTQVTTLTDFRMADMAANGQGAPLVPAFHQAVFSSENETRVILNIGGIANISVLPANKDQSRKLLGYDTGPGNMLMDLWIQKNLAKDYDNEGMWANTGSVNSALLQKLLREPYFQHKAPKSTGKELFNLEWLGKQAELESLSPEDIQRTLLELSAITISESIKESTQEQSCEIYICGGGIENTLLIERLKQLLPTYKLHSTAALGVNPQLVEAAAFAWLARQTIMNLPGNSSSVTGASCNKILGGIYPV